MIMLGEFTMRTTLLICLSLLIFVSIGCIPLVKYTMEYKGDSCIKFEDAMTDQNEDPEIEEWVEDCLGEDGAMEADLFAVLYEGPVEPGDIDVTIKAGKCKETIEGLIASTEYPGAYEGSTSECGFRVLGLPTVLEIEEEDVDAWLFGVISDDIPGGKGRTKREDGTAALSYVMFCLGDATVIPFDFPEEAGLEDDEFPAHRGEGQEEIETAIWNYIDLYGPSE